MLCWSLRKLDIAYLYRIYKHKSRMPCLLIYTFFFWYVSRYIRNIIFENEKLNIIACMLQKNLTRNISKLIIACVVNIPVGCSEEAFLHKYKHLSLLYQPLHLRKQLQRFLQHQTVQKSNWLQWPSRPSLD